MRRSLLSILAVAALSGLISRLERAPAAIAQRGDWVRTVDGWERRRLLVREDSLASRQVHPGLVAAFQLGASALALVAFPARVVAMRTQATQAVRHRRRRAGAAAGVAG